MHFLKQSFDTDRHLNSIDRMVQSNSKVKDSKFVDHEPRSDDRHEGSDDDNEIEFQTQIHTTPDHYFAADSPRLWSCRKASRDDQKREASFFRPPFHHHHRYSFPSPARRLQAIADSRRVLTGMIQNMPEDDSSFELSLKDIVVDKRQSEEMVREEAMMEDKTTHTQGCRSKDKVAQKNKKKTKQPGRQILRSESLDSGVFLLKMFVPVSLGSKKKSDTKTSPTKVSPKPSVETDDNHRGVSRSTSCIGESTRGLLTSNFLAGWRSSKNENCKSRRPRGCLF